MNIKRSKGKAISKIHPLFISLSADFSAETLINHDKRTVQMHDIGNALEIKRPST